MLESEKLQPRDSVMLTEDHVESLGDHVEKLFPKGTVGKILDHNSTFLSCWRVDVGDGFILHTNKIEKV